MESEKHSGNDGRERRPLLVDSGHTGPQHLARIKANLPCFRHLKWQFWIFALLLAWPGPIRSWALYPIQFVQSTNVTVTADFWLRRLETNRLVVIPEIVRHCEENGLLENFARAAGSKEGKFKGPAESDEIVYQALEAIVLACSRKPDPSLEVRLNSWISLIIAAQQPDGYLCTSKIIAAKDDKNAQMRNRWSDLVKDRELAAAGQLYQAAATHFERTGERRLLDAAVKNFQLIALTFGPGRAQWIAGPSGIELGLMRLYETTRDQRCFSLAKYFLNSRGSTTGGRRPGGSIFQDHLPFLMQTEAVGDATSAALLYAAATDITSFSLDRKELNSIQEIWNNTVYSKTYIIGGIGSRGHQFGAAFDLPNLEGTPSSASSVALSQWNKRMFQLLGDARYFDLLELTLYNSILSAFSLDGRGFNGVLPLESDGNLPYNATPGFNGLGETNEFSNVSRRPWLTSASSPAVPSRWLEEVPGLIYAEDDRNLYVNLFVTSQASVRLGRSIVEIRQQSDFPWESAINFEITVPERKKFSLFIRIPGWARNELLPGSLYSYTLKYSGNPILFINETNVSGSTITNGYLKIDRDWRGTEKVELKFNMPVRSITSKPSLTNNVGRIALMRGPIVYCVESVDNGGTLKNLEMTPNPRASLDQATSFLDNAINVYASGWKESEMVEFRAIPYFTWGNRGKAEMAVWVRFSQQRRLPVFQRRFEKR